MILSKTWWRSLVKGDETDEGGASFDSGDEGRFGDEESAGSSGEELESRAEGVEGDLDEGEPREARRDEIDNERQEDRRGERRSGRRDDRSGRERQGRGRNRNDRRDRRDARRDGGPNDSRFNEDDDDLDSDSEDSSHLEHQAEEDLSQPYDLDVAPRRPKRQPRARVTNAKDFFSTEIVYRFDVLEPPFRSEIAGSYRIELKGNRGGVWTIFLGDDLKVENRREDADIVFTMQQRDFVNLVNGELNPQLAMLSQKMRVTGDIRRASKAQIIFVPGGD